MTTSTTTRPPPGACPSGRVAARSPCSPSSSPPAAARRLRRPRHDAAAPAPRRPRAPSPTPAPVELTVGLGYIPSVQFAQFYLADQAGYYRDAGLEVTFENKIDPELITLVAQGAFDMGIADGTSVIPAVSQGIPVQYVFTVYADFPSIVFAKASSGIVGPADLAGKKVGIPGKYGSSWIQLQALLAGVGLTPADVEIVPFPDYGQLAALEQGVVDAATGFVNNEPVRMELAGTPTVVLALPPSDQLPGNGLIAAKAALAGPKADAIRRFIAATRKAMEEIVADPRSRARGRHRPRARAGDRPRRPARGPGGHDRHVAERLHRGQRDRRRRSRGVGAFDRVHERPARFAGGEAGHRRRVHRPGLRGAVAGARAAGLASGNRNGRRARREGWETPAEDEGLRRRGRRPARRSRPPRPRQPRPRGRSRSHRRRASRPPRGRRSSSGPSRSA